MTMPSTGPLNMGGTTSPVSVAYELGRGLTSTISMNDTAVRNLAGVGGSGTQWSMNSLYGKTNTFSFTISANTSNVDLRAAAVTAGWDTAGLVICTIASGVYISSTSTGSAAMVVSGSFPQGVQLINNGVIVGRGGNGGNGGVSDTVGTPGAAAGTALSVSVAISITNNGTVAGGGGGGGGGGGVRQLKYGSATGGGGGGGIGVSTGGTGANAGGAGTLTIAGTGGNGGSGNMGTAGKGGNGGGYGSAGASGAAGSGGNYNAAGGAGGAAGACTSGNANITWLVVGTRYGALN